MLVLCVGNRGTGALKMVRPLQVESFHGHHLPLKDQEDCISRLAHTTDTFQRGVSRAESSVS